MPFAEAAEKQQNVFDAEVGESQHANALLHVLEHVKRHRRPGVRCG